IQAALLTAVAVSLVVNNRTRNKYSFHIFYRLYQKQKTKLEFEEYTLQITCFFSICMYICLWFYVFWSWSPCQALETFSALSHFRFTSLIKITCHSILF